jgi:hypothetical protein
MDRIEQAFCRDRNHGLSRDASGNRLDDDELTGRPVLRVALPYAAVLLCLAVTAWLAFARLF